MDINKLLEGIVCNCGKTHTCNIGYVYIENDATSHLKEICHNFNQILIVADQNTFNAAGEITLKNLEGKNVKKIIFDGSKILVPDEVAIKTVTDSLEGSQLIVGIGSGVIQDLCKYVSHFNNIPYVIVATAPSMDGYASNGAAMITGGMKTTFAAGLPLAIVADTDVLKNAPIDMIKAGFGDVIGKFSALNDWKLSHLINNEYFCDYIYKLTYDQITNVLKLANGILKRDEESIKALMEALVVIGILMSFAGSSRPASGSEHHLSHFFEITGIIDNTEYFPHGIDVAYSTVITAEIREKLLSQPFSNRIYRETDLNDKINAIYKQSANGCIELQKKMGRYDNTQISSYLSQEAEIKAILAEMPTAQQIKDMLNLAKLDISEFYTLYGEEKIKDAILYAKDLKDRYTVLWLNYDLFGGELNVQ